MKGNVVVEVAGTVSSRYGNQTTKPLSWDKRIAGEDKIRLVDGRVISVFSDGMQSPPAPGWKIVLGEEKNGLPTWTLYGITE